jgi:hypothetical protein
MAVLLLGVSEVIVIALVAAGVVAGLIYRSRCRT